MVLSWGMARATIEDVARQAGVSVATVDRVLNGRAQVRPQTVERVEGAIRLLNYQPDRIFMVLVVHTSEFLVPDIENGCCTQGRDFNLDSGGGLDIYYRGQHATGTWAAADANSPLVFRNAAGQAISLPQGLVWVDVVGN